MTSAHTTDRPHTEFGVTFAQSERDFPGLTLVTSAFAGPFHPQTKDMILDCSVLTQPDVNGPILAGAVNIQRIGELAVARDSADIYVAGVSKRITTISWALKEIKEHGIEVAEREYKTACHSLRVLFLALLQDRIQPDSIYMNDIVEAVALYGEVMKVDTRQHPSKKFTEEYFKKKNSADQ
jgi:hypothetical protein